jgi:small subunit ribosomal protein S1
LSQLAPISRNPDEGSQEDQLAHRIGETLELKLLELNRRRNRVILSERQAVQQMREEQKDKLLEELQEGETRKGKVSGIASFGAFVDLGGADGLIHVSEISWEPVQSPEEVIHVGDELDVYVLKVDRETRRIALSLRRLQPTPWDTITDRYHVGQQVTGTVTRLTNFGAFARIEDSVEGLIHISELSDRVIEHPKEVVKEGDTMTLTILRIEPERRRLGLSLKQSDEFQGGWEDPVETVSDTEPEDLLLENEDGQ